MSTKPSTPQVKAFDAAICTPDELIDAIKDAGGCIIRNFLSSSVCDQIEKEVRPYLAPVPSVEDTPVLREAGNRVKDKVGATEVFDDHFFPKQSRRAFTMIDKSYTSAETMVLHPLWQAVANAFLTSYITHWQGQDKITSKAEPLLNNSICFSIMPGAKNQPLHRDDPPQHQFHTRVDRYPDDLTTARRDSCIGLFVAGKPATKQNGATRFIPGSHLWDDDTPPDESLAYHAEMEKGDAFIMLGSCFHGGSANQTKDQERLLYSMFYVRGMMRPEEQMQVVIGPEKVAKWPYALQRAVGYYIADPATGYIDAGDPLAWLVEHHGAKPLAASA